MPFEIPVLTYSGEHLRLKLVTKCYWFRRVKYEMNGEKNLQAKYLLTAESRFIVDNGALMFFKSQTWNRIKAMILHVKFVTFACGNRSVICEKELGMPYIINTDRLHQVVHYYFSKMLLNTSMIAWKEAPISTS